MKAAVDESQKSANVDLTHLLYSCKKCTECILKLQKSEADDVRLVRHDRYFIHTCEIGFFAPMDFVLNCICVRPVLNTQSDLQKALDQVKTIVDEQEKTLQAKISQLDGGNIRSRSEPSASDQSSRSESSSQSLSDAPDDKNTEGLCRIINIKLDYRVP